MHPFLKPGFIFIYMAVWGLSGDTQDLVPQPGIEPRPRALGEWSLSHWTTREIPRCILAFSEVT